MRHSPEGGNSVSDPITLRNVRMTGEPLRSPFVVWSGVVLIAAAALYGAAAAADLLWYAAGARPATALADPPRVQKLFWLGLLLSAAAVMAACLALLVLKPGSPQRRLVAGSTLATQLLWGVPAAYVLLVYYPLPPHAHHTEKALLASGALLLWSLLALTRPQILSSVKRNRFGAAGRILLINALLFLVVGELTLRAMDSILASQGFFGGKQTPAHLKPHMAVLGSIGRSNSQGFRDRERTIERGPVRFRALAIGDSQTYGAGVTYDETFAALLESRLRETEPTAEVLNLGVPGWEPPEELHLLKVYGMQFQPDVVLMNFYVGNDIIRRRGAYWEQPIVVAGQSYYVHATGNRMHDLLSPDRWFLYHHVNYVIRIGTLSFNRWRRASVQESDHGITLRTRQGYLQELDERTDIYLVDEPDEIRLQWDKTRQTLAGFKQAAEERGGKLIVVLVPDHVQVDRQLREEFLAARTEAPTRFDFELPQRRLRQWGQANGVATVDLLPAFRDATLAEPLYFETDLHLTVAGHRCVANGLWPLLRTLSVGKERRAAESLVPASCRSVGPKTP